MIESDTKLIKCPHCEGSGVCRANEGKSCATCIKISKTKGENKIVKCEICDGRGITETKSDRFKNRSPIIVLYIVLTVFYAYSAINLITDKHFDQIFPVVASLTTMIATFYFSRK